MRLLTEFLSPAAYGELALGMTVATLVNQVVLGPLSNGVTRFYSPALEQADLAGYLAGVRKVVLLASSAIAIMIPFAAICLLVARRIEWIPLTIAVLVFAILSGCNAILNGIQNAARQRAVVALHQGIEPWARVLFAAGLILLVGATSAVAMSGYAIAIILVLASQFMFFRQVTGTVAPKTDNENPDWKQLILKFSWPFAIFGIFTWVQLSSDRWALGIFSNTRQVGMYAVLFQLGYYPMALLSGMVMQLAAPVFYQRAGDARDKDRNADVERLSWLIAFLTLGATCVAVIVGFLVHAQVFRILAASEYSPVSYLLPWMLLSGGVFAAGQTIALNLMSQMKPHAMIVAKIATAVLGVVLNFTGAYFFGITGIVIASVMFSISYLAWMSLLSIRTATEKTVGDPHAVD